MSIKQPIFGRTMYLDTDVVAGNLVVITSDESVSVATTGVADGVAWSDGKTGEYVTVELFAKGIVEVVAGGTIVAGDPIDATTGGKGLKATAGTGIGKALTGGSASALVKVLVR